MDILQRGSHIDHGPLRWIASRGASLLCCGFIAFATYSPAICKSEPVSFWISDPVKPGETVMLKGSDLQGAQHTILSRLLDTPFELGFTETSDDRQISPGRTGTNVLTFMIPDDVPSGVYRYQIALGEQKLSGELNAPQVYWTLSENPPDSKTGYLISVFGRNICRNAGALLKLSRHDGVDVVLTQPSRCSEWRATFFFQTSAFATAYEGSIWNGQGDISAWRSTGMISMPEPQLRSDDYTIDVTTMGANGKDDEDDTASIQRALQAVAGHGGGTVFFPRGRYVLSDSIAIPRWVTLRGASQALVSLNWVDFDTPPWALVFGESDFSIRDVTINASNHSHIISGGFVKDLPAINAKNIHLQNIRIRASMFRGHLSAKEIDSRFRRSLGFSTGGPDSLRLSGRGISVTGLDVYGSGRSFFLLDCRQTTIRDSTFYNGRWGWYSITGGDGILFEHNVVRGGDLQSTGGSINTLSPMVSSVENVYVGGNKFEMINGWDREALTSDSPGGFYFGRVETLSKRSLRLLDKIPRVFSEPRSWTKAAMYVVDGQGSGQRVRIAARQESQVMLSTELLTSLDNTSIISIVPASENFLVVDNDFADAGVAVQFYGTGYNHVIAGNHSERTGGFLTRGGYYKHFQPNFYTQILENDIVEGNYYRGGSDNTRFVGEAAVGVYGWRTNGEGPPFLTGAVVRRNTIRNNGNIEVRGFSLPFPGVSDVLVEGNVAEEADDEIFVDSGVRGIVVRRNRW